VNLNCERKMFLRAMRRPNPLSWFAVAAGLFLSLGACRAVTPSPESALTSARNKWTSLAPASYTIIATQLCHCQAAASGPVIISVRNGVVESRTYIESGAVVPSAYASSFPTVEELFAMIDEAQRFSSSSLIVAQYDPAYGYPIRFSVGVVEADAPVHLRRDLQPR
jgi:Family of unknown function (DUF6174)